MGESGILTYFERCCNTEIILIQAVPQHSASDELYINMHGFFLVLSHPLLLSFLGHSLVLQIQSSAGTAARRQRI